MVSKYYLILTSDPGLAPRDAPSRVHRIVDHGTWLDIDGVRVNKRIAADPSHPMHRLLHEEIINVAKALRGEGIVAGELTDEQIAHKVLSIVLQTKVPSEPKAEETTLQKTVIGVMKAGERDKRTLDRLNRKHLPEF